jgi:hypothetical protein
MTAAMPTLLERETELGHPRDRTAEAESGRGCVVLVAGETERRIAKASVLGVAPAAGVALESEVDQPVDELGV